MSGLLALRGAQTEGEVIAHHLRQRFAGVHTHIVHTVLFSTLTDAALEGVKLALIGLPNFRRAR